MATAFFGTSQKYGTGIRPCIATNRNKVVEVHHTEAKTKNGLYYHIGSWNGESVSLGNPVKYDNGETPTCAINADDVVIEAHTANGAGNYDMWYYIGKIKNDSIDWWAHGKYDKGVDPSVGITKDLFIVETHESQGKSALWYNVGRYDTVSRRVIWARPTQYSVGYRTSIAINDNYDVVETHFGTSGTPSIYYRVGKLDVRSMTINWYEDVLYSANNNFALSRPKVSISNDGTVILAFDMIDSLLASNVLVTNTGMIKNGKIIWTTDMIKVDSGANISVGIFDDHIVQAHESQANSSLWFSGSIMRDNRDWMQKNLSDLGSKRLDELILPASHDACMYMCSLGGFWAQNQDLNIHQQLVNGVRYFDIRPTPDFHIYHGSNRGPAVEDVFKAIKRFYEEGSKELVILNFCVEKGRTDTGFISGLAALLKDYLGEWLYVKHDRRLSSIKLNEYIGEKGCVLALFEDPSSLLDKCLHSYKRFSDTLPPNSAEMVIFDSYSKTEDYQKMKDDQLTKFKNYTGKNSKGQDIGDLFLLSWTLTADNDLHWVRNVSKPANVNLKSEMQKLNYPNSHNKIPNLIYVDFVEEADVVNTVLKMNDTLLHR